jgi:predicted dehydrogenase
MNLSNHGADTELQITPSQPIRVGVIGVGNMGQHHTRVLSRLKNVELIGVSDINVELGLDTASKYRVRFFEDYHSLIDHVDAVCVAVPTRLHHPVGMNCLRAGIHVLIEKPIAANISEAESLVNAAAESNCILQVGHIERFNPAFKEYGTLVYINFSSHSEEFICVDISSLGLLVFRIHHIRVASVLITS